MEFRNHDDDGRQFVTISHLRWAPGSGDPNVSERNDPSTNVHRRLFEHAASGKSRDATLLVASNSAGANPQV